MKSALQGDGREVVENQTKLVISCMRGIVTRARESKISRTSQMEAPLVIETEIQSIGKAASRKPLNVLNAKSKLVMRCDGRKRE